MTRNWHHAGVPRLGPTLLSLALAGVMTLAAYTDPVLVGVAVLLVQVLIAVGPGPVDRAGIAIASPRLVPVLVAGVVATALSLEPDLLTGADGTSTDVIGISDTGVFAGAIPGVAAAVFVALVAQMLRRDGRTDLVQSVGYAVLLSATAVLAIGWIGAAQSIGGAACVAVAAAGVGAGLLAWMLPVDRWICLSLATLAGAAAGAAVVLAVDSIMTAYFGVLVGAAAAILAVVGQVVARTVGGHGTHPSVAWGFPGAMAIALVGPVAYLGGQLVTAA
ncbi:MAG: hypothetical protein JWQ91_2120 [Aeromicrobium sp.]|jgi:hypothetical protein|nr:hypothetical protein [Aeromicrobium sp.]MCW2789069.1 hypothetical protein [Aeromicrobium sp.]MCW2825203.1 hypothetical protein [Aeromicrobium sp.]